MYHAITISRELGSGGREIGYRLSRLLRIPVYDKEIISAAAENSNIAEAAFQAHDEVITHPTRAEEYKAVNPFSPLYEVPVSDQLFLLQSQAIRELAQKEPCIVIGRCSDVILENCLKVFICCSLKKRVERLHRLEPETPLRSLEARAREIDRKRRDYYQYYSGNEWGNPRSYDLCLNSGRLGVERCVALVADAWKAEADQ